MIKATASPGSTDYLPEQNDVLEFLGRIEAGVRRIDTHASIIFLCKDRALKVKRAVRLSFLDYSTCEKRKQACIEELEINRRFACDLYRRVVPVTRASGQFTIDGNGTPVEWIVEMARFDEERALDRIAGTADVSPDVAIAIADEILRSHSLATRVNHAAWPDSIREIIDRNTAKFRNIPGLRATDIDRLDAESQAAFTAHIPLMEARKRTGFVRRCHGDLHLGNIVLIDDRPVLFDAIEFDPQIATTDTLYDIAFTLMDLVRFNQASAANALFNRFIARTDAVDQQALSLLPLFLSMRAAIRALVFFTKGEEPGSDREASWAQARQYFDLAAQLICPEPSRMVAVGGLSGTGKSALSRSLAPLLKPPPGALVFRSDAIRKALFGVAETEHLPTSAYGPDANHRVYGTLMTAATRAAKQGISVVIDASFLRAEERTAFDTLPADQIQHIGFFLEASTQARVQRIRTRKHDASDATPKIAVQQKVTGDLHDWRRIDASGTLEETVGHCVPHLDIIDS